MQFLSSIATALSFFSLTAAVTFEIKVGQDGAKFDPDLIMGAGVGDV